MTVLIQKPPTIREWSFSTGDAKFAIIISGNLRSRYRRFLRPFVALALDVIDEIYGEPEERFGCDGDGI